MQFSIADPGYLAGLLLASFRLGIAGRGSRFARRRLRRFVLGLAVVLLRVVVQHVVLLSSLKTATSAPGRGLPGRWF